VTLGFRNLHDYALREGARERFRLDGRGGIFLTAAEQALEAEPDQVRCAQPLDDREGGRGGRQERRESYSGEGGVRQGADLDAEAGHEPRQPATLHAPSHDVEDRRARHEQERQRGDDEEPERGWIRHLQSPLRGLRFPAWLRGAAGDEAQEEVRGPCHEEGKEQAVVVEAFDQGWVLEDAAEVRGCSGSEKPR